MLQLNPSFIKHIEQELPSHLSMDAFIAACNRPLRQSIRVNTLKIASADFINLMSPNGWQFTPIPWCEDGFWLETSQDEQLGNTVEHIQGLFYIQEASSMLPPIALFFHQGKHLSPENMPEIVLDMASAPGSKSTQIAALMDNKGLLIANEYSASRVKVLHANVLRMGVSHSALTHFDGRVFGEYQYESFDAILLDAPCGGEGTIRKDPNALKQWQLEDVEAIALTQAALIHAAFLALKPGGSLVYSTCTLNQLENQGICQHLLALYPDAVQFDSLSDLFEGADKACTREGFLHVWPQIFDTEGFFIAKITKTASVPRLNSLPKQQKNFPFAPASQKQTEALAEYLSHTFSLQLPEKDLLYVRDDEYWLFPQQFIPFIGTMRFQRIGLKVADAMKKGFKVKHEAIIALANDLTQNPHAIALSKQQAQQFLMGRDIDTQEFEGAISTAPQGEMIASYLGCPLGVVKHLGHRLKNNLPRELVRDKVN